MKQSGSKNNTETLFPRPQIAYLRFREHDKDNELFCAGDQGQTDSATFSYFMILLTLTSIYLWVFFSDKNKILNWAHFHDWL